MKFTGSTIGQHNLISGSLVPFHACLIKCLDVAINNTLQDLFSKAELATSNQEETRLFEQYNLLKKSTSKLLNSLTATTQTMPDEITEQISMGEEEIRLSLVEDEDLEISLAFTQLEAVLDIKFTRYLYALEKRLKILFAAKNITKSNMPFGVTSVCWIFSQTLDFLESDINTKSNIIEKLRKQLSVDLLEVYKAIDKKFAQAGILPNIKIESRSQVRDGALKTKPEPGALQTSPSSGSSQANSSQASSGAVPNSNVFNQNQNQQTDLTQTKSSELVNSIFDLMNQGRIGSQSSGNQSPFPASNIDNSMLDNALNNLSKITSVAAGSTEIDKLKEMVLEGVKNETGIYYPSLTMQQQNSLDVMGMFYEQVKEDTAIDNNMISSLNAINIPLIRTAINDQQFFENEEHPAREYLEKIIYAAQKWHGTSVVKKLHKFSSNIASEYDGTPESFALANEDLESFLRLTQRRAIKAEEKWINAARGKEKLEISRHKVEEIVENVSQNAVPDFVKNVIKYVIQDSLTLSLLRHGEDSDEWHKNINTSTVISKMANPELIKELTPKQKIESLHHLDQTMNELGFSGNDRSNTLNNIKECANAAMNGSLQEDIVLQEVPTINKNKKNIKKPGSAKIEDLRPLTDKEKSELTKIRLLPYGTIFDFITNQQRDKIRRRLSWFSPVSNKALFVSLLGKRPYEKSLNAVAIDLARKNIIIVKPVEKRYFKGVMGDVLSKLKGLINSSTNTQSR
ncbi:MAG: DUF1631 domain-containing protein [Proteobacteria bacterium]|nr:DUF1631 domain-containing protein [Pseudomonadota bacterium]